MELISIFQAKNKYHDEKERALALQRDRELALWHQRQVGSGLSLTSHCELKA
jgi:hypothetical protein